MTPDLSNVEGLNSAWLELRQKLQERFGKAPDLNATLMIIGIQETGKAGLKFTKEQKQDLMHVAVCHLMSSEGYYQLQRVDDEGWPHYELLKPIPDISIDAQEELLKEKAILYFQALNI